MRLTDYSNNNGDIDFHGLGQAARAGDVQGCHWKASTGVGHMDTGYEPNKMVQTEADHRRYTRIQKARQAALHDECPVNFLEAPYHWLTGKDTPDGPDPDDDGGRERGRAEGEWFLEVLARIDWKPRKGGLLPMLDVEEGHLSQDALVHCMREWARVVEKELKLESEIIYGGAVLRGPIFGDPERKWLNAEPLMLPVYGGPYQPFIPASWKPTPGPAIHQYTSRGSLRGFRGFVDLSNVLLPKAITV